MSLANRRSKQPEQFRAHLLKVAVELVVNEGYESLTLDKVARRAGVSKGGLQYHFSSKAALLQGVYDSLCAIFEPMFNEALAREPEGPKRYTRAYIRACFTEIDPLYTKAMFILTLALPEFAQKQGVWMQNLIDQDADQDTDSQSLLLCRFAADGLWIAETSGVLRFDEATRTALLNRLLTITDSL